MNKPKNDNRTTRNTVKNKPITKKVTATKTSTKKNPIKKSTSKKKSTKTKKIHKASVEKKETVVDKLNEVIIFDAVLTINEVKVLLRTLINTVANNKMLILDASKVEMVDTATIQLLISFISSIHKKNIRFKWHEPSAEFIDRVSILNLTDALDIGGLNLND